MASCTAHTINLNARPAVLLLCDQITGAGWGCLRHLPRLHVNSMITKGQLCAKELIRSLLGAERKALIAVLLMSYRRQCMCVLAIIL